MESPVGGTAGLSSMDIPAAMSFGKILKESFMVLRSRNRLFLSITITLTVPLCFAVLAHHLATGPIMSRIRRDEDLATSPSSSSEYLNHLRHRITIDRVRLAILLAAYALFVLVFALISTAAVVYTVACIFTKRSLTFRKILTVIPKVWKRLLFTFIWAFIVVFGLAAVAIPIVIVIGLVFAAINMTLALILWWIISVLLFGILFHFACVFNLANVISVLEECYGFKAIRKGNDLIKGMRMDTYIFGAMYLVFSSIMVLGFDFASSSVVIAVRVILAIVFGMGLACVDLVGIIVFTILYFACKAHHHEPIDSFALSEHLGAYTGEYVNLRSAVQMEAVQV